MRLIFIRHPKTEANEKKLVYGRTDALYSAAGAATIPGIVEALHGVEVDRIYASPLTRTRILAERIAGDHGIPIDEIRMDDRILEMDFGRFENMTISELEKKYPREYHEYVDDFNDYQVPGGESYRQLYHRVGDFLKEIYQRHERGRVQEERAEEVLSGMAEEERAEENVSGTQDEEVARDVISNVKNGQAAAGEAPDALELEVGETEDDETREWLDQRNQKDNGAWFEVKSVMDGRKKKKEETVVVVAHSMVIHAALAHLLNLDLNDVWHIKIEPGSVVDLDWRYDFAMLQHLAGPFNVREIR